MRKDNDRNLTPEQVDSILSFLKTGGQVFNPIAWKKKAIGLNYVIAATPAFLVMLNSFGLHIIVLTPEQATLAWQIALSAFGVLSNIVLSITSRNISLNPFDKTPVVTTRGLNDSDE